jgi:hypothetical protein
MSIDAWEPELFPDEIACPVCGQLGRIQVFATPVNLPGVPEGAITLDGVQITWYPPQEEEVN